MTVVEKKNAPKLDDSRDSMTASRSLTETHRNADVGKTKLDRMVRPINYWQYGILTVY